MCNADEATSFYHCLRWLSPSFSVDRMSEDTEVTTRYSTYVERMIRIYQDALQLYFSTATTAARCAQEYTRIARSMVQAGTVKSLEALRQVLLFAGLSLIFFTVLVCILCACLGLSLSSTVAFRYYMLSNVVGNQVVPLRFNSMPLHTDWWRYRPVDEAISSVVFDGQQLPRQSLGEVVQQTAPPHSLQAKHLDFTLDFLREYVHSVLATSGILVTSAAGAEELYLPGGGVNVEALFHPRTTLFSSNGEYASQLQIVLLKEEVGRQVPIVVQTSALFAEDEKAPQSLASLDVLFTTTSSAIIRTGAPPTWWVWKIVSSVVRVIFYVPIVTWEYACHRATDSRSAPFDPINHDSEVAVILNLYEHFVPPPSIKARIRAINFTVYQKSGSGRSVTVSRIQFFSTVKLRGILHGLTAYPVASFLVLTMGFFSAYTFLTILFTAVLAFYLYRSFTSKEVVVRWKSDSQSLPNGSRHRRHLPTLNTFHPSASEVYELQRPSSASFFSAESMSSIAELFEEQEKDK